MPDQRKYVENVLGVRISEIEGGETLYDMGAFGRVISGIQAGAIPKIVVGNAAAIKRYANQRRFPEAKD